jgi:hypothetical protein
MARGTKPLAAPRMTAISLGPRPDAVRVPIGAVFRRAADVAPLASAATSAVETARAVAAAASVALVDRAAKVAFGTHSVTSPCGVVSLTALPTSLRSE